MTIDVTQQDINRGRRRSAEACPIALAIRRQTGSDNVEVTHVHIHCDGVFYMPIWSFQTPFDLYGKRAVKPSRFTLERMTA